MSEEDVVELVIKLAKMGLEIVQNGGTDIVVVPPCHNVVYTKKKNLIFTEVISVECKGKGVFEYKRVNEEIDKKKALPDVDNSADS